MPDETDTLTTSQTSSQNFALDGIGEGKSHSGSGSQSAGQSEASFLVNSSTGSHSTLVAYAEPAFIQSQESAPTLFTGRREIPVLDVDRFGVAPLAQVVSDSETDHYFVNDDPMVVLEVVSLDASVQTVTIETSYTQDELPLEERVVSIPAGGTKYIGSFPFYLYNQGIINVYVNPSNNALRFRAFKVR